MNGHLRVIAERACRQIDLTYPGDALPSAIAHHILKDIYEELGKLKWAGEDEGWDRAIKAVREELATRYGVRVR